MWGKHGWLMPGKPTDNAFIEVFDTTLHQECLNQHWFLSLAEARAKLEQLRVSPKTGSRI